MTEQNVSKKRTRSQMKAEYGQGIFGELPVEPVSKKRGQPMSKKQAALTEEDPEVYDSKKLRPVQKKQPGLSAFMQTTKNKSDHITLTQSNPSSKRLQLETPTSKCIRCGTKCIKLRDLCLCQNCEIEFESFHPNEFNPQSALQERLPHHQQQSLKKFVSYSQDTRIPTISKQRSKKRKSYSLNLKQRNVLKLPCDPPIEVYENFRRSFFAKRFTYTNQLVYDDPIVPESLNDASLEPHLQKLTKENQKVLEKFRTLNRLPPVLTQYDDLQGFSVKAACDIPELTLLAEYCGQVRAEPQLNQLRNNDSIMELLCTGNPKTSLNVVPLQFANIARFFSGINNSILSSKQRQQNIRTMRCQVDGKATVLLYTQRAVKKGEPLRFDYNEAGKDLYPTQNFV